MLAVNLVALALGPAAFLFADDEEQIGEIDLGEDMDPLTHRTE